MLKTNELFDLDHTLASPLLSKCEYPWTALGGLRKFITELGITLPQDEYYSPSDGIWVANSATLAKSSVLYPPCIVGKHSELLTSSEIYREVFEQQTNGGDKE